MRGLLYRNLALSLVLVITLVSEGKAETADVKYRGLVDLAPFKCVSIDRSSFIRRVCYDAANSYMIVKLNETYYHYCAIDNRTVDEFEAADSMGRFFNASIRGPFRLPNRPCAVLLRLPA
jgi:hypothetical protein